MGERLLTSAIKAEIVAKVVRMEIFAKMEFDSGSLRMWTGIGDKTFLSEVYKGVGELGGIDRVDEQAGDVRATGITLTLSGIPASLRNVVLTEHFQNRPVTIWAAFFDSNYNLIADEVMLFRGSMDYPVIHDGPETISVTLFAESRLIDLERPRIRRYTDEDQRQLHPTDTGLRFMAGLQNRDIVWKQ